MHILLVLGAETINIQSSLGVSLKQCKLHLLFSFYELVSCLMNSLKNASRLSFCRQGGKLFAKDVQTLQIASLLIAKVINRYIKAKSI